MQKIVSFPLNRKWQWPAGTHGQLSCKISSTLCDVCVLDVSIGGLPGPMMVDPGDI